MMNGQMNYNRETVPSEVLVVAMNMRRKSLVKMRNVFIFGVVAFIGYSIWAYSKDAAEIVPMLLFMAVFLAVGAWLINRVAPGEKEIEALPGIADRIETGSAPSHKRFLFFEKDGKWGVYDYRKYRVVLPAKYDSIDWYAMGTTVRVSENGQMSFIPVRQA